MLHFQGRRPTRNYLGRREQWRLMTLFGMLALVLVLMRVAGREQAWHWMFSGEPVDSSAQPEAPPERIDSKQPAMAATADVPDVMRIQRALVPSADAEKEVLPGLRKELFASVVDDTVLRGGDEHAAFFRTLTVLSDTDEQEQALPQPIEVGFVQLHRQPESYRGEWIRVRGVVRRALPIAMPKNEQGIEQLYQLWLQPDGRPDDLLAIDVLQLPPGFPSGEAVKAPVTIDGVFFKRWAYQAHDAIRTVPLVLARTVVWTPTPSSAPAAPEKFDRGEQALAMLAVLCAGGVILFMIRSGRNRSLRNALPATPNLHHLAALDHGNDVARMLAEVRDRETAGDAARSATPGFEQ